MAAGPRCLIWLRKAIPRSLKPTVAGRSLTNAFKSVRSAPAKFPEAAWNWDSGSLAPPVKPAEAAEVRVVAADEVAVQVARRERTLRQRKKPPRRPPPL